MPSGFWIRAVSALLDGLLIGLPVYFIIQLLFGDSADNTRDLIMLLYAIILPVVWNGFTVGKRMCGIRIVKMDGGSVGIGTMLLRVVVAGFIYGLTLGAALLVSIIMVVFREDKRAIHDFIAGTQVVDYVEKAG